MIHLFIFFLFLFCFYFVFILFLFYFFDFDILYFFFSYFNILFFFYSKKKNRSKIQDGVVFGLIERNLSKPQNSTRKDKKLCVRVFDLQQLFVQRDNRKIFRLGKIQFFKIWSIYFCFAVCLQLFGETQTYS